MTDFADWIRDEIRRRGWSQASLADRAGLSRSSISKMLTSGRRKPGMRFFVGIATAFEMPVADVILAAQQTRRAFDDAPTGKNLPSTDSVDSLFDELSV